MKLMNIVYINNNSFVLEKYVPGYTIGLVNTFILWLILRDSSKYFNNWNVYI